MKRSVVIIIAAIVCVIAVAALYLFSPIGTGRDSLNDKQVESLCSYFGESWFEKASDEASPDFWNDLDTTRQTAVRIIGTEDKGELKVLGVFRTEKTNIIAGGEVLKGDLKPGYLARVIRDKKYLGEAEVTSVQKERIDVKELVSGETGGLALKTTSKIDLQINDRLKFFTRETRKRTL